MNSPPEDYGVHLQPSDSCTPTLQPSHLFTNITIATDPETVQCVGGQLSKRFLIQFSCCPISNKQNNGFKGFNSCMFALYNRAVTALNT